MWRARLTESEIVSIEQLLMMSTELLANWEWLPGEPLSGLECLKAQLDFRYKISAFFTAFYSEYWLSKNKSENERTEMNSVVNIKSYKSHPFQKWVMIHHVWTISYNILAFMGHSWLSYALKWTGITMHGTLVWDVHQDNTNHFAVVFEKCKGLSFLPHRCYRQLWQTQMTHLFYAVWILIGCRSGSKGGRDTAASKERGKIQERGKDILHAFYFSRGLIYATIINMRTCI